MSGKERQQRHRARVRAGRRMVMVEVDEIAAAAMLRCGDADIGKAIGRMVEVLIAIDANEVTRNDAEFSDVLHWQKMIRNFIEGIDQ